MKTSIQITQEATMLKIKEIASRINLDEDSIEYYGQYKAKILIDKIKPKRTKSHLILVTATSPTPLGEGKSTTTIGLVDALCSLDYQAIGALREPSLGPVFGIKGGACGGGYAQVNPMADINLHFNGDLHAITAANNLISACLDNHIFHGNELKIDPNRITWRRCMDLNDRALREVVVAREPKKQIEGRSDFFNITVASEIMAILCLAKDQQDLSTRINDLILGYSFDDKIVTVKDLGISGAVMVLLKDAVKPNLVQTLENNPIVMHGGPFANIAHGCNSLISTKAALSLADYVVTEAGFGADLGAEKFLDIKCRIGELVPSVVVIVTTIKALKYHGTAASSECLKPNMPALQIGISNLKHHINIINNFGLPYVVAINRYEDDPIDELTYLEKYLEANHHPFALSEVFAKGSIGGQKLAQKIINVVSACQKEQKVLKYIYDINDSIENKIEKIAKNVYGAEKVVYKKKALEQLSKLKALKMDHYYVCMAKTPLSITDDPKKVGIIPTFDITIKEIRIAGGANFIICLTGDVMTMPGLPKKPKALEIYLDELGKIHNLS